MDPSGLIEHIITQVGEKLSSVGYFLGRLLVQKFAIFIHGILDSRQNARRFILIFILFIILVRVCGGIRWVDGCNPSTLNKVIKYLTLIYLCCWVYLIYLEGSWRSAWYHSTVCFEYPLCHLVPITLRWSKYFFENFYFEWKPFSLFSKVAPVAQFLLTQVWYISRIS